jgi:hypothetical protein
MIMGFGASRLFTSRRNAAITRWERPRLPHPRPLTQRPRLTPADGAHALTTTPTRDQALAELTAPGQPFELAAVPGPRGPVRAFANAPPTLGDLYAAHRSDLDFLVYEEERMTLKQVWAASCALARALIAGPASHP